MDAQAVINSVTKQVLYLMIEASGRISLGGVSPDDLNPAEIGKHLDEKALLEIQKALQFARAAAPAIVRQTQDHARELITAIRRERAKANGWQRQAQL